MGLALALALLPSLALGPARAGGPSEIAVTAEDGRAVTVTIWAARGPERGVILFSHGALSAPSKYRALLEPWSEAGYRILAPLHVDSTDHPDHARYGMADSWRARLLDMRAVAKVSGAPAYIAAGHSYGALVALTLGGVTATVPPGVTGPLRDPRAVSALAFSPPGATPGLVTREAFADLKVPALIETGDRDVPPNQPPEGWRVHLTAFDAAPPGLANALVLDGADHYFGGLICRLDLPGPPQTEALARALPVSLAFFDVHGVGPPREPGALDALLSETGPARLTRK